MPNDDTVRLIGSTEAIRILGVSRATLTRWAASGEIRSVGKLSGDTGALIFKRDDVEALAEQRAEDLARRAEQAKVNARAGRDQVAS